MVLRIIARNDFSYLPSGLIKCIANKLVGCTRRTWNLSLISRCYHRSKEFIVIKIQLELGDPFAFFAVNVGKKPVINALRNQLLCGAQIITDLGKEYRHSCKPLLAVYYL